MQIQYKHKMFSGAFGTAALILVLLLASISACAEELPGDNAYLQKKDSVFLVNQSVFIDAKKISNQELFKKLETAMGRKILDEYIPIVYGTAFLINPDGHLITAFHVVKYVTVDSRSKWALYSFLHYISKYIIPGYLSTRELNAVCTEFKRVIAGSSDITITMKSSVNNKVYAAQVIAQSDALDLALLKITLDQKIAPIALGDSAGIKVGDPVMTIGYPLQSIMDQFLDDFKPTVTNGIVSALRTDNWDIQHTASINSGNSGGPLLTKDGRLVGVNVGTITKANNIYFSTNSNKLRNWLKEIGKSGLVADSEKQ
jgi:S1-C subfamily serine protease